MSNNEGTAVGSLVCGILAWFFCPVILGIVAIVLGSGNSHGLARAGVILGWLNIIFYLAFFVFIFFIGGLGVLLGS